MIITALAMVAMLVMAAIVVDLGSTRAVRGQARATADAAATAGATDLGSGGAGSACATALGYAFANLGGDQPTAAAISSSCSVMAGTCTTGTARVARLVVGDRTVQATNPVPDASPLLRATAVGGGVGQAADPVADGSLDCQRIGIEITQPQSRFFGGIASSSSSSFSIHSVARYRPGTGGGTLIPPAVVVLNQHTCKAIDTGSGKLLVESTVAGPGIVYSDSDGTSPLCTGGDGILHTSGSGALRAAQSASAPGQLAWYSAPSTRGYVNGRSTLESGLTSSSYAYVGKLYAAEARTTRAPADKVYHCSVVPAAPCTTDPVRDSDALARAGTAPATFSPAPSASCTTSGGAVTLTGNVFVDCDAFEVKNNPLIITGGANVIFRGRLVVASGGTLAVNVSSAATPALDAAGLPVAAAPAAQTRLIVGSTAVNAIDISTNSAALYLAQTFVYSRGGFSQQALKEMRWSPPSSGATKSLLYWSDAALPLAIQGGPALRAAGVMFQGNGTLTGGGGGTIDLTNVQLWVDKVLLSGSTVVKLAPDPNNSIKVPAGPSTGSALIR